MIAILKVYCSCIWICLGELLLFLTAFCIYVFPYFMTTAYRICKGSFIYNNFVNTASHSNHMSCTVISLWTRLGNAVNTALKSVICLILIIPWPIFRIHRINSEGTTLCCRKKNDCYLFLVTNGALRSTYKHM